MARKTTFQLKNELKDFNSELETKRSLLLDAATGNEAEKVSTLESEITNLETCRNAIKAELEKREKEQIVAGAGEGEGLSPEEQQVQRMANFYKEAMRNGKVKQETRAALGDNSQGGDNLLPKNVSNQILVGPLPTNPLRKVSVFTNIVNLEVPTLNVEVDGVDFLADDTTAAKELEATGGIISFGRNKFKVKIPVTETILAGTDTGLVAAVQSSLQAGLAAKEKSVAFNATNVATCESFYDPKNAIKAIEAETLYKSIKACLADLDDMFIENAKIVMRRSDYYDIIETLANNSATLYAAQPEQVLGAPVEFCDKATTPVIGDFGYSHFNYDPTILFERDKNVDTGIELFVLTAWIDHKIKLKSAFRLAKVKVTPPEGGQTKSKK